MPETKKPEEKAKREEFRRYLGEFILKKLEITLWFLDQAGLVDQLTQFLVNLYEEQEKPTDAISYMRKALAQGKFLTPPSPFQQKFMMVLGPDTADVESLKVEIEKLKEQLADMTSRAETAEASVAELQGKLDASEADQSEPKEEPKPE